jgi:hypothetical protein
MTLLSQKQLKDSRGVEINNGFAERTTFIVTQDGGIFATIGGIGSEENVEQALLAGKRLTGRNLGATRSGLRQQSWFGPVRFLLFLN